MYKEKRGYNADNKTNYRFKKLVIMLMMQSHWQKNLKKQFSVWKNSYIEGQKENMDFMLLKDIGS